MPDQYVLAVNAGSSSLKLQLFSVASDRKSHDLIVKCSITGLTSKPKLNYKNLHADTNVSTQDVDIKSDTDAFHEFLKQLDEDKGFGGKDELTLVCHRVVHGGHIGEKGPAVVTEEVDKELEEVTGLAPLHNGPALSILKTCKQALPKAVNIAFFDSSYHSTMPAFITTYAIDQKIAKKKGLRKYGFHGISYQWIVKNVAKHLGKKEKDTTIIALHLGSGASVCAIKDGKSYDTTMGLTPLEGLPGGSRSGSIDPSLIFHYTSHPASEDQLPPSVHLTHAEALLNSASGFKALAGTSDFGAILGMDPMTPEAQLTIDLFVDRILGFVGSYWLKLGGGRGKVDAFVFAGGIGEKGVDFRKILVEAISGGLGDVGGLDEGKNKTVGKGEEKTVYDIGKEGSNVGWLVCMTNEELEMVQECTASDELWGAK